MELEDGVVYQDDPGTSAMMSERVSGLAGSIYREFERLIGKYDEDVVKELMPLVVAVLENLDSVFAENQEHEVELELLKEDNEQLITQYEREKALRKHAEEKFIEFEDSQEQEKKELQGRVETLQSHARQLELRTKNYADQISRLEEREAELKKEFNSLHQRHTEMIHTYMELLERSKLQQLGEGTEGGTLGRIRKERPLSLGIFSLSTGGAVHTPEPQRKAETPTTDTWKCNNLNQSRGGTSLKPESEGLKGKSSQDAWANSLADESKDELSNVSHGTTAMSTTDTPQKEAGSKGMNISCKNIEVQATPGTRTVSAGAAENETSDVQAIIESTPELDMDPGGRGPSSPSGGFENLAFDRNTDSLFEELSSAGTDLIGDVDEGADLLGMGREVENLILENTQLLETKNALNVVKNDLMARVDELGCEREVLQGELDALKQAKTRLEDKNRELEEELKKVRAEVEEVKQKSKDEEDGDLPTAQRKRFTRVEMARVLMERNQYKERLMELQEAVRWTEMIRASRENPTLAEKKKSSIWQFFSRLFSPSSSNVVKKSEPSFNVKFGPPGSHSGSTGMKRSKTLSELPGDKSKVFDFLNEEGAGSPALRREHRRAAHRQVKPQVQKQDGRVQAHGWSVPHKHKATNGGQAEARMKNLPVPVYLRPLEDRDTSMKVCCAAGVDLSGGGARDVPGEDAKSHKQRKGSQSSLDQPEQDPQEGDAEPPEEPSSLVWICSSSQNEAKITVLNAKEPAHPLQTFPAHSTHILCICSVPGVQDTDYPVGEEIPLQSQDDVTASGSEGMLGNITAVGCTVEGGDGVAAIAMESSAPQTEPSTGPPLEPHPSEDDVTAAEEATEATEASEGGGEGEAGEGEGLDINRPIVFTEHVFTDPLGAQITKDAPAHPYMQREGEGSGSGGAELEGSEEAEPHMSSALPTMWLGTQSGGLFVHSAVSQWKRCLHSIKLKESVLCIVHVKGRVLVALADGTLAIFHRGSDGQWDLTNYHLLDLGRPHHSIRCMAVVHDRVWCGYRNKIYVVQPKTMRIEKCLDAHPRRESQVRLLAGAGDGIWVSIRLDSTLRLFHASTYQHLQDVDIEPYVSKMLGTGKLGFSFVRITALMVSSSRLWIGTGNGVIISIPLTDTDRAGPPAGNRPGSAVRIYGDEHGEVEAAATSVPFCSMAHAQLCFHGHKDAVKFFAAVPGQVIPPAGPAGDAGSEGPGSSEPQSQELVNPMLVMSGGEGYVDFRAGDEGAETEEQDESKPAAQPATDRSHLIVWQVM
ncbi:C-Jun-amino-terminal kinase-interacting protein 4-like isoform X2 [Anguilla rostrata]|uniref:C-Jun-amino-terminal kinase-interacting protein 4-like isoform X2 n=1 Tax=Anguilla rostrata TaxID=7938 RepID=UPI0030CE524E